MLIDELPKWVNSEIPFELQVAALEDWFTNIRLICEFYRISGREKSTDFSVLNFLDSFDVEVETAKELNEIWLFASKHITHLTNDRIPIEGEEVEIFDYSLENMNRICKLIGGVRDQFEKSRAGSLIKDTIH